MTPTTFAQTNEYMITHGWIRILAKEYRYIKRGKGIITARIKDMFYKLKEKDKWMIASQSPNSIILHKNPDLSEYKNCKIVDDKFIKEILK
jgi:hypothetical protein